MTNGALANGDVAVGVPAAPPRPAPRPALRTAPRPAPRPAETTLGRDVTLAPLALRGDRNALTVDLEDWYHNCTAEEHLPTTEWDAYEERITRNTLKILRLLDRFGVRATFFVLGYIAERHPGMIRAIAEAGHEIGTHGHHHRRVFQMTPEAFRADLRRSIDAISSIIPRPVIGYRSPMWSVTRDTLWAIEIMSEEGILYDSSIIPATWLSGRDLPAVPFEWRTPAGPVREFPAPTVRCLWENLPYSGGLPMRMAPYFYVVSKLRRTNRMGLPGMVYIHPWEFDEKHPRADIPYWSRFIQNFNLRSTPSRVEGFLRELDFCPMSEVLGLEEPAARRGRGG